MRVMVTGSRGFIGSAVARELASRGWECVPFDLPDLSVLEVLSLTWVVGGREVDAVINLAGMLGTAEIFGDERRAAEVNIIGAVNVFDAAEIHDVPVVQIGTGHRGQLNPYAITKAAAEDIGLARARWRGEKVTVVRAYHVYGPGQKACLPHGPSPVRKIVPSFACRALTGMDVEVNGDGAQVIDLVHVDDVARVLVDAVTGPYGEVVEAGTGKATTVLDAARDVVAAAGSAARIVHVPMRVGEPDGAVVVASDPRCSNPWPYRLGETVDWYRGVVAG